MKHFLLFLFFYYQAAAQLQMNTTGKFLDKNRVKTRISSPNYKFWNVYGNGGCAYEVPKGKGTNAMSANSIWIGGLDHNGAIHMSANTYRQSGDDWWPGPLDTLNPGAFTTSNSAVYNKLWKIDCNDINAFVNAFNNGQVTAGTYTVPDDILNYPAKGIAKFQKNMAPFYDVYNNGIYDPVHEGDYPIIKGQQQILSIFNDSYSTHTESGGRAMGLEVQERSYAYSDSAVVDSMQAINYTTFYHYTIYNRSDTDYFQVHVTDWADVDLGYFLNDYIGTDTLHDFAYTYNYGTVDLNSGISGPGYGTRLPVLSIAMIKTNCLNDGIDNDGDGATDEAGEQFHLNKTTYYTNNFGTTPQIVSNPMAVDNPDGGNSLEYYNYMTGFWKDGSPFTADSMGYGGTVPAHFIYPGDPSNNSGWTEGAANNVAGDRRILFTSGPFRLPKRSKIEWEFAVVFSQDTLYNTNTISEFHSRVQRDVRNARYYDSTHQAIQCAPAITHFVGIKENKQNELSVLMYPNPANNQLTIELLDRATIASITLSDVSGRSLLQKEIIDSDRAQLDLSAIDQGVYFIEVKQDNKRVIKKIIKN